MEQSSQDVYHGLLPILADDHGVSFGPSSIKRSIMWDLFFDDGDCWGISGALGSAGDVISRLESRLVLPLTQPPMCWKSGFILGCIVKPLEKFVVKQEHADAHAHNL